MSLSTDKGLPILLFICINFGNQIAPQKGAVKDIPLFMSVQITSKTRDVISGNFSTMNSINNKKTIEFLPLCKKENFSVQNATCYTHL